MRTDREILFESLSLFDRPESERLRDFLPANADVEALVTALFAPLEGRAAC